MQHLTRTAIALSYVALRLQARAARLLAPLSGQGLVEYSLILAMIVIVVIGIMTLLGQTVSGLWYQRIMDSLNDIIP